MVEVQASNGTPVAGPGGHNSSGLFSARAFQPSPLKLLFVGRRQRRPRYIRHHVAGSIDQSDICRLHE